MSYDLYFWRQDPSLIAEPGELSAQLQDGVSIPGIVPLHLENVVSALRANFPEIQPNGRGYMWEGAGSYFDAHFTFLDAATVTCVTVNCGFELLKSPDTMNLIIDAFLSLGMALYDPQTGERYLQD